MTLPTRRLRRLGLVASSLVLVAALGCGSDKTTGPNGDVTGTYTIVSTNGPAGADNSAPFVLFNSTLGPDSYRIQIPSGSITLNSNKTYAGTGSVDVYVDDVLDPGLGDAAFGPGGTYSVSGSTVKFTPSDGSSAVTATFSGGNTLTFSESVAPFGTMTIVARK